MSSGDHAKNLQDQLQQRIGYRFRDPALLKRALTHRSAVPSDRAAHESYQRQEFLGDRVLALVVAEMLFTASPEADEGDLARRLNQLVRRETCAEVAEELEMGQAIRLGTGERQSGGRTKEAILGDVAEALIAAIFLDGGFEPARDFVLRSWKPRMERLSGSLRDAKTTLQEWAQGRGLPTPRYDTVSRSGPDHAPIFIVRVTVSPTLSGEGAGKSKRDAEQEAAAGVLRREGLWSPK